MLFEILVTTVSQTEEEGDAAIRQIAVAMGATVEAIESDSIQIEDIDVSPEPLDGFVIEARLKPAPPEPDPEPETVKKVHKLGTAKGGVRARAASGDGTRP